MTDDESPTFHTSDKKYFIYTRPLPKIRSCRRSDRTKTITQSYPSEESFDYILQAIPSHHTYYSLTPRTPRSLRNIFPPLPLDWSSLFLQFEVVRILASRTERTPLLWERGRNFLVLDLDNHRHILISTGH